MSKINYDDYAEDDEFSPCVSCGNLNFYMDWEDNIYRCTLCDESIPPKSTHHARKQKDQKVRKFKVDDDVL